MTKTFELLKTVVFDRLITLTDNTKAQALEIVNKSIKQIENKPDADYDLLAVISLEHGIPWRMSMYSMTKNDRIWESIDNEVGCFTDFGNSTELTVAI
jgi:hypothetical protein